MSCSNINKWYPKTALQQSNDQIFGKAKSIERELKALANKFATNINFNLLDYYVRYMACFYPTQPYVGRKM